MRGFFGKLGKARVGRRLARLERLVGGARTTYIGNNRLITGMSAAGQDFTFLLDAEDRLLTPSIVTTGVYDVDLTQFIARTIRPDSHSIDVGTNFGYFTCLLAKLSPNGRVVGIEAEKRSVELAHENVLINGVLDVATIIHAAASDTDAAVALYRRVGRSGNTSIGYYDQSFTDLMREPPVEQFTVRGIRVDDAAAALQGRVDFIKIDVEGAEPLVLAGARETIAANPRLVIAMEWSPGQIRHAGFDVAQFVAGLADLGLDVFDLRRGRLSRLTSEQLLALPYRAAILLKRRDAIPAIGR